MDREEFGKEFYERAIEQEGADFNFYGDWQKEYAKMVISITDIIKAASDNRNSLLLDVGCACGVNLKAFKEKQVFGKYLGVDISEYLLNLGKETHGFDDEEMKVVDITEEQLPVEDNSVTLLHCTNVLEHIPENKLEFVIKEFKRVLEPKTGFGFIVVPAIKPGNPISEVSREQSHLIIQSMNWWRAKFAKKFYIDNSVRKNFKTANFSPTNDESTFHDYYNKEWTIFGLRKEK